MIIDYNTEWGIQLAIVNFFDYRRNLILPNASWGLGFNYELDLLIITKTGHAIEIEIKTARQDLKNDIKKGHGHTSKKVRRLYFAITPGLEDLISYIPEKAGIIVVDGNGKCKIIRNAKINADARKIIDEERKHIYELINMRYWKLRSP